MPNPGRCKPGHSFHITTMIISYFRKFFTGWVCRCIESDILAFPCAGRKTSVSAACLALACWGLAFPVAAEEERNVFGQESSSEAALMGIFYDLKQTQDHKPTGINPDSYWSVMDEFLSKGWDETVFNKFYRVSKPLYTTQIFIPSMNADSAPKAFNAPSDVKPSRWFIHYKGQISPPEPGTYRLVGSADDTIAAAINGKTCLVYTLHTQSERVLPKTNWKPDDQKGSSNRVANGNWIEMKPGEIYDLDILIGERPGSVFNAYLLVERKGAEYKTAQKGKYPVLPIFQVGAYDTPVVEGNRGGETPEFAKGFPVWKSYQ